MIVTGSISLQFAAKTSFVTVITDMATDMTEQIARFSEQDKGRLQTAIDALRESTQHISRGQSPSANDNRPSSNHALLQKANNQEKTQAALSPTDQFKGQTALQGKAAPAPGANAKTNSQSVASTSPTVPAGGWSRGR